MVCLHWLFMIDRTVILYLLRDRLGIKPLYYYYDPDNSSEVNFAFASELKSLLQLQEVKMELDYSSVERVFTFGLYSCATFHI